MGTNCGVHSSKCSFWTCFCGLKPCWKSITGWHWASPAKKHSAVFWVFFTLHPFTLMVAKQPSPMRSAVTHMHDRCKAQPFTNYLGNKGKCQKWLQTTQKDEISFSSCAAHHSHLALVLCCVGLQEDMPWCDLPAPHLTWSLFMQMFFLPALNYVIGYTLLEWWNDKNLMRNTWTDATKLWALGDNQCWCTLVRFSLFQCLLNRGAMYGLE